jgi:vancomycin resistance protein YoaR
VAEQLGAKVAGFTVLGLFLLGGAVWGGIYLYAGDEAPRNAKVEGVSIAGLSPAAAEKKLRAELESRTDEPISVSYGDGRTVDVDPRKAGLSIDYPASIREAGGGSGSGLPRMWDVVTGGGDHHAEVAVDQSEMQATLDDLSSGIGQRPREGGISFKDGRAVPVYGEPGRVVSRTATQNLLERRFLHGGSQKLPTEVQQPGITDDEVRRALADFGRPAMSGPVTFVLAGQKVVAPPRLFAAGLSMEDVDGELRPRVDGELMLEGLQPVMRTIGRDPENARFEVHGGRPVVVPAKVGVTVDPAEIEERFAGVAVRQGALRRLVLTGKATQPAFSTADAQALKITERVSTFTTHFPYADYRNVNLSRAAQLIDGTVLRPGETFSLNDTVGERTKARGFTEGYLLSDGHFRRDLGGGVSQIATPTFNAMYFAGLEDVEHTSPSVHVDGDPAGREATVAWPSVDLKFTNTTPYGVLIKAAVHKSTPGEKGAVTVSMYSTRHWRITSSNGPRSHVAQPRVRYLQTSDCQPVRGAPIWQGAAYGEVPHRLHRR